MTREQWELLKEMGPYTLSEDGILHNAEGVSMAFSLRPNRSSEECEWDRALVAALNLVCELSGP